MRTLFWTIFFVSVACWRTLAGDLLWEKLTEHKIDSVSVIYMSDAITTRTPPTAEFVKQHYTHSFNDKFTTEQDPFFKSFRNLLTSSRPVGTIRPPGAGNFRWCVTVLSTSSMLDSTTEIYLSRGENVARIGNEFYSLDNKAAQQFFKQFEKLFGF